MVFLRSVWLQYSKTAGALPVTIFPMETFGKNSINSRKNLFWWIEFFYMSKYFCSTVVFPSLLYFPMILELLFLHFYLFFLWRFLWHGPYLGTLLNCSIVALSMIIQVRVHTLPFLFHLLTGFGSSLHLFPPWSLVQKLQLWINLPNCIYSLFLNPEANNVALNLFLWSQWLYV